MGCLYKLTSPSGKSYIGITSKSLEARWRQHHYNANKGRATKMGVECDALYNAIRKYGADTFQVQLLATEESWSVLCFLEQEAIAKHHTLHPEGYNLTHGGEGSLGQIISPETRARQSASCRKRLSNPDELAKAMANLSKAVRIRQQNWWNRTPQERKEWGARHSQIISISHASSEWKAQCSERTKKLWQDPEYRKAIVENRRTQGGKYFRTTEWKQAMAERRKREWSDPIMRQKRLQAFAKSRQLRSKQRNRFDSTLGAELTGKTASRE